MSKIDPKTGITPPPEFPEPEFAPPMKWGGLPPLIWVVLFVIAVSAYGIAMHFEEYEEHGYGEGFDPEHELDNGDTGDTGDDHSDDEDTAAPDRVLDSEGHVVAPPHED